MSRAMSAAELVVMAAVICVSLGVMLALPFRAEHQPDRGRSLSGKQRRGSVRGRLHIAHAQPRPLRYTTPSLATIAALISTGLPQGAVAQLVRAADS